MRHKVATAIEHRRIGRAVAKANSADPGSVAYQGLHAHSILLDAARFETASRPAVNLVMATARRETIFAGVRTALKVGARAATLQDRPLRIVSFKMLNRADRHRIREITTEFGLANVDIVDLGQIASMPTHCDDTWLATYWTTAHCLQLLADRGMVDASKVVYLVQDYEPMFYPASTDSALAEATYSAGFNLLVNSEPLAQYVRDIVRVPIDPAHVFRPELDWDRLRVARNSRTDDAGEAVLFYHRPYRAGNMNALGVAALRRAADLYYKQSGRPLKVLAMGSTEPLNIGPTADEELLGRVEWDEYFSLLGRARVLLSLQATPHPSHPPLDMVLAGGRSVTNDLDGTRCGLHPRLAATRATPDALAGAVLDAVSKPTAVDDDVAATDGLVRGLGETFDSATASVFGSA